MGKINSIQFCSILIMIILQAFFGLENNIFTISIINLLLNFIIGLITLYIFIHIFSFKKELPINDKIKLLFSNKTSILINIILIICYLNISITIFYNLNTFIMKQYLDKTPLFIIGTLFLLIIVYINTKGFETLSRVSLILLFLTFISILISSLSLFEYINLNNLKLSNNIYISSNIFQIFILLIIPKNRLKNNKNTNKYIYISYIITFIILINILINTIGILGNLSNIYQYPEYITFKRINLFNFINRIENILIIKWIFESFIYLSLITLFISKTITKKNNNYLYIIITLLPLLISLLFKDENSFINYFNNTIPITNLIVLLIFLIISIKSLLYNQNNNNS